MKLKLITAVAATVVLSAFTIASTTEKDVVGSWKIDSTSIDKTVKKIIAKAVEANPDSEDAINGQKDMIVSIVQGIRLNINADHTYASVTPQGSKPGKWALTNNGHTLQFTKEDGTIRKDSVLESSATRLKLINRDLADTILYVHP
ncbi:hypothetical protein [Mucilaginibacter phyllosphaerae]|uniref:Lipocalin-like domain-containing protein n=1 Tax=Mucilaginibacter phyllosphaerae TaxID=1812349 RepID=A0A4Y8AJ75_9SPHI|nr:hypothetical protein [Mucilaginibacter phyllosphaerae]MBB3967871.1 hypothetical protein [Mucilaginibacter phyllosphaerae]TEW69087.1 hypothetical protein E2R65_02675 [Mucilaginibacter phyllosphaerae]GGH02758.1 hypothetical protein GCM10007352_05130 [Mucilaginibacter phyllosphaerae]